MITGDYHHTAIAVAKGVGMVQPGSYVVVIDTIGEPQLRSELSTLKRPQSVASRVATPNFTPRASFSGRSGGAFQDSPVQEQKEQQMLFAAFEKADPDNAFEPELLTNQSSGKHQHWDFEKADSDHTFPPQLQRKQSQGKHQHWEDDQTMLEPVYGDRQSIQDTAAQSCVVGQTQQGVLALPGDGSMKAQSASQLQLAEQAALSHQVAVSRQQSAVSRQQSAVSWQQSAVSGQQSGGLQQQSAVLEQQSALSRLQSAVSRQQSAGSQHHHRKLSPLTGAEKMRLKLSGQLLIPAEAQSQQQQLQQHEHQHLVGLETVQTSGSVKLMQVLLLQSAPARLLSQVSIAVVPPVSKDI